MKSSKLLTITALILGIVTPPASAGYDTRDYLDQFILAQACPSIAGTYRTGDGLNVPIEQSGCFIKATIPGGFFHQLQGFLTPGVSQIRVLRTNLTNGCTTVMFGRLQKVSDSTVSVSF